VTFLNTVYMYISRRPMQFVCTHSWKHKNGE